MYLRLIYLLSRDFDISADSVKQIPYGKKTGELPTSLPMGCTWATEWAARGLPVGILPCKLGCLLLPYMEIVGSSVGSPLLPNMKKWAAQWAAEWATHWLSMGILPCKLGCPLLPYTDIGGSSVGNSLGSPILSSMEIVGSSVGSQLNCPLLNDENLC